MANGSQRIGSPKQSISFLVQNESDVLKISHIRCDLSLIAGNVFGGRLSCKSRSSSALSRIAVDEIEVRAVDSVSVLDCQEDTEDDDCLRIIGKNFCKTAWIVSGQLAPGEIDSISQEAKF